MGFDCIALGCPDLRELSLKWCIGVSHLGLDLLALKSKKLNILDLSYTMDRSADSKRCLEISCGILDTKVSVIPGRVVQVYAEMSMLYDSTIEFEVACV
ncbi:hypothetical protein E2562_011638 [Oryza meyeriana var. granulata]|uniref:Uncharacterized protein n=1 Tax=Oryza meyeriana var. granulata TaxID=110450 RepID=A0A6G1DWE3_9ORYZ|nr:hypothetical protein E2562_011638 [Oryza meyeriana var. granulata]